MKMNKKIIILVILIAAFICNCDDNSTTGTGLYKSNGIITGIDMRECMCCGGWFIEISDSTYRFSGLPADCNINFEQDTLPLAVKLDWNKSPNPCLGDEIIIIRMKKD